jgi:putative aminopeptidase FrvX
MVQCTQLLVGLERPTAVLQGGCAMSDPSLTYMKDLLVRLLNTPSPTGDTEAAIALLEAECRALQVETRRNRKGALIIHVPGQDTSKQRFVTAHVDTLGGIVKEILPTGRLRLAKIGSYAWNTVEGEYCHVRTERGDLVSGTVILHNTSVHVNRDVATLERKDDNIEVVLDANVQSKQDTEALGIAVGDFVYWDPRVQVTPTGYIKSRHLDDKASVAVVFAALRSIVQSGEPLPYALNILISNNEEIGYGGNSNIPPETVEYLAVDMGAIGDGLSTNEHCVSICAKDGSGPYHLGLRRHLVSLCRERNIPYAVDIYPYYSSDASAAMLSGADVVHGLIGPGVANSHAYERTHQDALKATFDLLMAYLYSPLQVERPVDERAGL